MTSNLAAYYGLPFVDSSSSSGVSVQPPLKIISVKNAGMAGILDQGSVIVSLAKAGNIDAVARGHVLVQRLFCRQLGAPPADAIVAASKTPFNVGDSARDRLGLHLKAASCAGCHVQMDPLGLAFDGFAADGRPRATVPTFGGTPPKAVDATGTLSFLKGGAKSFRNSVEFSQIVSDSSEVEQCTIANLVKYAVGADNIDQNSCEVKDIVTKLRAGKLTIKGAVKSIAMLSAFRTRKAQP